MTKLLGPQPPIAPRLRGDLAVWLVICAELLTFALLFIAFAAVRLRQPTVFANSQSTLDLRSGAINTVLLISGSACVAHAVQSARAARAQPAARWLVAAMACGAGFLMLKSLEYADKFAAGIDLETNTFWMFYLFLTGFHFLHVAAAMVMLVLLWAPTRRGAYSQGNAHALETGAAFWHMVDLLWIVLFPLVYVMR
ncbi:MAG: cytochrome c oxidase subunit 3 [Burkholderiaceae bacterium]|jgi:nitric oxide reductase NorE protein|nr:cytochrome c oxidase subunit 3 [Burkholderiaceae bacterium]